MSTQQNQNNQNQNDISSIPYITYHENTNFRFRGRKVFLTYSRYPYGRDTVIQHIKDVFGLDMEFIVASDEVHPSTGASHVHCVCKLKRLLQKNGHQFDISVYVNEEGDTVENPITWHPNVIIPRYLGKCVEYCIKDGTFTESGVDARYFVQQAAQSKDTKQALVANDIDKDVCTSIYEVKRKYPDFVLMHSVQIKHYFNIKQTENLIYAQRILPYDYDLDNINQQSRKVCKWLKENLNVARLPRQKQLFLYGPPGTGKTKVINRLRQLVNVYTAPRDGKWWQMYNDQAFDLIAIDEFVGNISLHVLNQLLDGQRMWLEEKNGHVIKDRNQPIIITSNRQPEDFYTNVSDQERQAFFSRVELVHITTSIDPVGYALNENNQYIFSTDQQGFDVVN